MSKLTYADYLNVEQLLSLQNTRSPSTASKSVILAEQFFIITHQSCELWLKQATLDLEAAADLMQHPSNSDADELALELLQRTIEILRVLQDQLSALEKLPLRHFAEFRVLLDGASGSQSAQFRSLARLLGSAEEEGRLYSAFELLTQRRGLSVAEVCTLGPGAGVLNRLADSLLDIANGFWHWKVTHLALVSKMVGDRHGTGSSTGVDFLARRVTLPFPTLRQLRGQTHMALPDET